MSNNEISENNDLGFPRTNILELSDHRILVIGGTPDIPAFIRNFINLTMVRSQITTGPSVGGGFWIQAQALFAKLREQNLDQTKPMIVVGHSLGGAIGRCVVRMLKDAGYSGKMVNVSFGCPKISDGSIGTGLGVPHLRCVYNRDLVTQIPLTGAWFNVNSIPPSMTITNFQHEGICVWLNPVTGNVQRVGRTEFDGMDLSRIAASISRTDFSDVPADASIAFMAADHSIWNYVQFWRLRATGIPRHVAEGFDGLNTRLNDDGSRWDNDQVVLNGVDLLTDALPEDPVELLPFPQDVPDWDPTVPPPVPRTTPTPTMIRQRALRGRRTL